MPTYNELKEKFINAIAGRTPKNREAFKEFLNTEQGKRMFDTLLENKINTRMSSILNGAGANAASTFKDLYDLWFDREKHPVDYLKTLKENGVDLARMSSILSRAGANAASTFKDLYEVWFDREKHPVDYLKTLKENGVDLARMSSILNLTITHKYVVHEQVSILLLDQRDVSTLSKE